MGMLNEKAKSKSQQQFMGMVRQCQKTGECTSAAVKKAASNMKQKDVKDFAKTKHKNLPKKVSEGKMTFKQFLVEVDAGDLQLAKTYQDQQQSFRDRSKTKDEFKRRMSDNNPNKGDVINANNNNFVVTDMSVKGIRVKQVDGNKSTMVPHGTKFKRVGTTSNGNAIFKIVK